MQEKGIINTNQFIWMLFVVITSFTALQVPGLLIFHAGRDAWLSAIGGWLLDVLLALVYAYMGIRFQGQNFVQYSETILGKYLGKIIGIMFPIFFLMVCAALIRSLSMLMVNAFFTFTPVEAIIIPSYIFIAYAVRKGIETIARICEILGVLYFLSFIVLFILVGPSVDLEQLKPQFENGIYPFLTGAPLITTFYGICIIMGMYIPICNKPENGFLSKFTAVSMGAFVVTILVSFCIGIFGISVAENLVNPGLVLTRAVEVGHFLQRVEILWMLIAISAGIVTCASLIWAVSLGLSQITAISTYKPLVLPVTLIASVLSIISMPNIAALLNFGLYTFPIIGLFVETGLEVFLFITALILNKRYKPNKI